MDKVRKPGPCSIYMIRQFTMILFNPTGKNSGAIPRDQYVTKKTGRDVYAMVRNGKKCKNP
jgi:hypothetical protein